MSAVLEHAYAVLEPGDVTNRDFIWSYIFWNSI